MVMSSLLRTQPDRVGDSRDCQEGVRVHGVLWIIDKLHAVGICGDDRLIAALQVWRDAPVRIPAQTAKSAAGSRC